MKRIVCMLLTLIMLVSAFPMEVFAMATGPYEVWVNGEEFTKTKTEITCGSGTATIDASTTPYTLTLHNAYIDICTNDAVSYYNGGICSLRDLNIVLEGDNKIEAAGGPDTYAIFADDYYNCERNLTFEGTGTLDISVNSTGSFCAGIRCGHAVFNGGNYTISANSTYTDSSPYAYGIYGFFSTTINGGSFDIRVNTPNNIFARPFYDEPEFSEAYKNEMYVKVQRDNNQGYIELEDIIQLNSYRYLIIRMKGLGVWVNGEQFTNYKKRIQCDSGTATLDTSTSPYTLTLQNVNINRLSNECVSSRYGGICSDKDLDIVLEGSNKIELAGGTKKTFGILAAFESGVLLDYRDLTFKGDGTLEISVSSDQTCAGIKCDLAGFYGGKYTISANTSGSGYEAIGIDCYSKINGGTFDIRTTAKERAKSAAFYDHPTFSEAYKNNCRVRVKESTTGTYFDWDGTTRLGYYIGVTIKEKGIGVWVNGEEFTNSGKQIQCGSGTATLDTSAVPYTLTLHNANIDTYTNGSVTEWNGGICSDRDLNIVLEGSNKIELDGVSLTGISQTYAIFAGSINSGLCDLTFEGDGTLDISVNSPGSCAGIKCGDAVFNGGTYMISANSSYSGYTAYGIDCNPTINGGIYDVRAMTPDKKNCSAFKSAPSFSKAYKNELQVRVIKSTATDYTDWNGTTALNTYYGVKLNAQGLGIWVNGEEFTGVNAAAGIKCGDGKATLDRTTTPWTVTLNNAEITNVTVQCPNGAEVYAGGIYSEKDIQIKLVGRNKITTNMNCDIISGDPSMSPYALYACIVGKKGIDVTLTGTGDLELDAYKVGGVDLESDSNGEHGVLTIDGGNITGKVDYMYCKGNPGISYKSGNLELYSTDPNSRYSGFLAGSLDDTYCDLPYEFWAYDYHEDGENPEWKKCTIKEFENFYEGTGYSHYPSGIKFVPVNAVTFDPNGGSVTPTGGTLNASGKLASLPTPTRSGYSFNGWYTAKEGGTKVNTDTVFTEDTTIYAQWTKNSGSDILKRLKGSGRQATAAAISKEAYTSASNVIIASGDNYADALAGVPLANAMNAPILLVCKSAGLDEATKTEIKRLGAKNVYILGGTGAIPETIENAIRNLGCTVTRVKGSDRFATAVEIANKLKELKGAPSEVFFVYSHNYPDALAVSGIAAAKGEPILYVAGDGALNASEDYLKATKSSLTKAYIIGGTGAIKPAADENIGKYVTTQRVYGKDRYLTCSEINKTFASTLTGSAVCIATGKNFPDALAGGVLAAKTKSPMLLVGDSLLDYQASYITSRKPSTIYVFGGTSAVSDATAQAAVNAA